MNIPILTKIGSKMGGTTNPKWDPIGFDPQPGMDLRPVEALAQALQLLRTLARKQPAVAAQARRNGAIGSREFMAWQS